MKIYKNAIKTYFLLVLLLLVVIGILQFFIDPYQQYRQSNLYKVYFDSSKAVYLNAGIAKNYNYDSIVVGSSMAENFSLNQINYLFNTDTIKLTLSGATAHEINIILSTVINQKKVKNVFLALDPFAFSGKETRTNIENFPIHLYDDSLSNDFKYIYSLDTLKDSFQMLFRSLIMDENHPWFQRDTMYSWMYLHQNSFGEKQAIRSYLDANKTFNTKYESDQFDFKVLKRSFDYNILPVLEKNKKVKYYVFFPPYSVLAYRYVYDQGWLDEYLQFKKYIVTITAKYNNVEVFDFQVVREITNDLDNYKDITHYSDKINAWQLDQIHLNRCRVTGDNVNLYNEKLLQNILDYQIKGYDVQK